MKRRTLLRCCLATILMIASNLARALEPVDGVYQLGSLDDYKEFAELVNSGSNEINAVLTADINLGEEAIMIGTNANPYAGVFDGQGHTISIAWTDCVYDCGIFQYMAGTVRNLHVTGTLQSVNQHPATVVGRAHSKGGTVIENIFCDVEMTITKGYDTGGGGILAYSEGTYKMTNVVFAGKMIGDNVTEHCGGFVGWSTGKGEISNCLFVGEVEGLALNSLNSFNYVSRGGGASWENVYYVSIGTSFIPANVKEVESSDVASGALAFTLNNREQGGKNFYQTIGTDKAPVPFTGHGAVYCKASNWLCDGSPLGTIEYTNDPQVKTQPEHQMEDGFCDVCGTWDETYMSPAADGWYEVKNASELAWWATLTKKDQLANMRLMNDIEMDETANGHYVAPGTLAKPFCGHIDGQHHSISGLEITNTKEPIGLIAVMNSEPATPSDATAARAAEPAYIKNLRLDETCVINGSVHTGGFVGEIREWAGNVLLEGLGMEGTVNGNATSLNCGAILGCATGRDNGCTVTLRNSYATGGVHGHQEDGMLAGWIGTHSLVENCYAIGECDSVRNESAYLVAPATEVKLKNVYTLNGTQGTVITDEDVTSGALCTMLIGTAYDNLAWFQTLGDDNYPVNDPTHGIVVRTGESYMGISSNEDVEEAVSGIQTAEYDYLDEAMAEQRLIDDCRALAQTLSTKSTIEDFLPAYTAMLTMRDTVVMSTKVYASYVTKCEEVTEYLNEHHDFFGSEREALEEYLKSNAQPSEDWPLGGYVYITEKHLAADSLINKEIVRVQEMLDKAIGAGYQPGMDITNMLVNPDLSDGTNGWDGTAFSRYNAEVQGTVWYVGESSNSDSTDISQTLTGLKPGYYKFTMNASSKIGGNRYNYDQHAMLYANESTSLISTLREGMISKADAIDGENCNVTGSYVDHVIYTDGESTQKTEDNDTLGYVPMGMGGMIYAMNAGRYEVSVIAKVGEDSTLTVGLRRNASDGLFFQLLFGNARLMYCGTEEDASTLAATKEVLEDQLARANTILTLYDPADNSQAPARSYPAALKEQLQADVAAAGAASSFAEESQALENLTATFRNIIDGKEAYYAMYSKNMRIEDIAVSLSSSLTKEESDAIWDAIDAINEAYNFGTMTTEEARKAEALDIPAITNLLPKQDEKGIYHIANGRQLVAFASIANGNTTSSAKVDADIDMKDMPWTPIGKPNAQYKGTFDGQGHRFSNFLISGTDNYYGMFGQVTDGAVIRNFVLDNTCSIEGGGYTAVIGGNTTKGAIVVESVGMEGNVTGTGANVGGLYGTNMGSAANLYISNCYVTGTVIGGRESAAICGWSGGAIGTFTNCWTNSDVSNFYFADSTDYIIRNVNYTKKHVFSTKGKQGDIITDEQLASGEICYILNEGNTTNPKWYQTLGTDPYPVLDSTHGVVGMKADSTYTNQSDEWLTTPEVILDIAFNKDGSAYDASPMKMNVETMTSADTIPTPTVYYNEEVKRNVVRLDNIMGEDATQFYKVDFEQNMLFRSGLENGHSLEMLVMADYEDEMPDVSTKPFSAMQVGGTGFETAVVDGVRQFRFNPNASSNYISTWGRCDSKFTPVAGEFCHIIGVWDSEAGEARIYVNGELAGTSELSGRVVFPNANCNWFGIGGDPASAIRATNAWRGDIAIARVYSNAITADQVAALYKNTGVGIADAVADTPVKSTGIYTINGIRVQKTSKGLYIINGKKVMVK